MYTSLSLRILRFALPFFTVLALILLGIALTPTSLRIITPPLLLPAVYFWATFSPTSFSPVSAFILGLICDVLMGLPLGAMPLTALFLFWLARRDEYLSRKGFKMIWLTFCWHGSLAMLAYLLMLSLYQWHWMAWPPVLIQTLLILACYPAMHWLCVSLIRKLRIDVHG